MTDISDAFSKRLRQLREEARLTQTDLGKLLGSGKVQVSRYETGAILPSANTLVRLADTFTCSVDYLLGRSDARRGEGRQVEDFSPEERFIIDAIREKRYSRLMHMLAMMFDAVEEAEDRYWSKLSAIDPDVAEELAYASREKPRPFTLDQSYDATTPEERRLRASRSDSAQAPSDGEDIPFWPMGNI